MQISWWTMLLQGVNFLVLVWLLQRFLYRPVQEVIEKRKRMQLEAAAEIEEAKRAAEQLKRRYEAALSNIDTERNSVLDEAHAAIEVESAKLMDDAKRAASDEIAKAREDIQTERSQALARLRDEIAGLAMKEARAILAEITNSIPNDVVLEQLEAELLNLAPTDRERLESEIAANGRVVEIFTARKLELTERQGWQTRLERAIGHPMHVNFEEDTSLLSGAVLRLPHMTVDASWADRLKQARHEILKERQHGIS